MVCGNHEASGGDYRGNWNRDVGYILHYQTTSARAPESPFDSKA